MGDYHGFMPTGVPAVDEILWAVDDATNAHHNATWWVDEQVRKDGPTYSEHIQKKANDAAALIASAPSLKEENERLAGRVIAAERQAGELSGEAARLKVALRNLTNNVRGLMAFEDDLRAIAGNTNVNALQEHLAFARAALGETES